MNRMNLSSIKSLATNNSTRIIAVDSFGDFVCGILCLIIKSSNNESLWIRDKEAFISQAWWIQCVHIVEAVEVELNNTS